MMPATTHGMLLAPHGATLELQGATTTDQHVDMLALGIGSTSSVPITILGITSVKASEDGPTVSNLNVRESVVIQSFASFVVIGDTSRRTDAQACESGK